MCKQPLYGFSGNNTTRYTGTINKSTDSLPLKWNGTTATIDTSTNLTKDDTVVTKDDNIKYFERN